MFKKKRILSSKKVKKLIIQIDIQFNELLFRYYFQFTDEKFVIKFLALKKQVCVTQIIVFIYNYVLYNYI